MLSACMLVSISHKSTYQFTITKHPNIIKIRGTINVPGHPEYSLILDRLYDTLEVQMKKWQVDITRHQGKLKGLIGRNKMMLNKIWNDRLVAAYDLARAMAYLHSRRYVFEYPRRHNHCNSLAH